MHIGRGALVSREHHAGEELVAVNGRAQEAEVGAGEAPVGLDWTPQAAVSHPRLLSMGATQAGSSSVVLMEPDKAQRTVTEMIKGWQQACGGRQKTEEWKDGGQGSLDQSQAEGHPASCCRTETGMELPHEVKGNGALFNSHQERRVSHTQKHCFFI